MTKGGFAQLGCFGGLGDRIKTPNLDKLAKGGLRFSNMHCAALCSPSRSAGSCSRLAPAQVAMRCRTKGNRVHRFT